MTAAQARSDSPWGLSDRAGCALGGWQAPAFAGRPPFPPASTVARPGLWCGAALVLVGLVAALAHWGTLPIRAANPKSAGFNLQADASSSKLKDTSAGAPGASNPAPPLDLNQQPPVAKTTGRRKPPAPVSLAEADPGTKKADPVPLASEPAAPPDLPPVAPLLTPSPAPEKEAVVPPLPPPLPSKEEVAAPPPPPVKETPSPLPPLPPLPEKEQAAPPPGPLALAEQEVVQVSVAAAELAPTGSQVYRAVHPGEIPMTRSWKMFGLQTALATFLATAPAIPMAAGQEQNGDGLKDLTQRIEIIEKALKKIQEAADIIANEGLKVEALKARIAKLEESVARIPKLEDAVVRMGKDLGNALQQLSAREKDGSLEEIKIQLEKIEKRLVLLEKGRQSRFPPETGRVLLTNNYSEEMLFIVNRATYRLAPGTSRLLDARPAGTFTYEVVSPTWGSRARKTTTLVAGETVRITVD